ncbi:hypothetical protein PMAYCL1PPCAC_24832, partial [Pristionchus mayeri]
KSRLDDAVLPKSASNDGSFFGFIRFEAAVPDLLRTRRLNSPTIEVLGMPWCLVVWKKDDDFISLFLGLHRLNDCDMWSIEASVEFRLVNVNLADNEAAEITCTYNHKGRNWGISEFFAWEELIDESQGFVKDGKITIETRFTLSNMTGIRIDRAVNFSDSNEPYHDVALVINGEKIHVSKQPFILPFS